MIALQEVLGEDGTLVMPTHSASLSDPAARANPPVPQDWWQTIRDTMPAYDVAYSPTQGMGSIVEVFRRWPGGGAQSAPAAFLLCSGAVGAEDCRRVRFALQTRRRIAFGQSLRFGRIRIALGGRGRQ